MDDFTSKLYHILPSQANNFRDSIKFQPYRQMSKKDQILPLFLDFLILFFTIKSTFFMSVFPSLQKRGSNRGQELTKTLISDFNVPQVNSQIVGGHERLLVAVQRDRVDVIGVRVGEHTLGHGLDLGAVHVLDDGYVYGSDKAAQVVAHAHTPVAVDEGIAAPVEQTRRRRRRRVVDGGGVGGRHERPLIPLAYLPQLDRLVVCGEEEVRDILSPQPLDLVYLLLDLQALQVVELGLVTLERAIYIVLGAEQISRVVERLLLQLGLGGLLALEYDYAAALVACSQQLAVLVELDCAYDVRLVYLVLGCALHLREIPLGLAARVHFKNRKHYLDLIFQI
jgi:hypothetical protein